MHDAVALRSTQPSTELVEMDGASSWCKGLSQAGVTLDRCGDKQYRRAEFRIGAYERTRKRRRGQVDARRMLLRTSPRRSRVRPRNLRKSSTARSVVRAGAQACRTADSAIPVTVSTYPCSRRVTPPAHGRLGKAYVDSPRAGLRRLTCWLPGY